MSALDALLGQLDPNTIQRMAGQLGVTPQQTQSAIQAALPLLMGAMQRNAASPGGAGELHRAVTRDHQSVDLGSLLGGLLGGGAAGRGSTPGAGGLGGLLGGGGSSGAGGMGGLLGAVMGAMGGVSQPQPAPQQPARSPVEDGMAILGHVFGQQQPRAAQGVAQVAGMDPATAAKLMAMLAPMLMGVLGQATKQGGLDAGGLAGLLGQETQALSGGRGGAVQQLVSGLLDKDGDGKVDANELLQHGASLLQGFLRK